jgi:exodeoxyribonuclease X
VTPLSDAVFVVLDTETTDKDPVKAELLEVAARQVDANGVGFAHFETLVAPESGVIPVESSAIHGLTIEDFSGAPSRAVVDHALRAFVPVGSIVVAHNAEYDSRVLDTLRNDVGNRDWLCTERLAHHLLPEAPNYKLGTLRYYLGAPREQFTGAAHRAMADVDVAVWLFKTLVALWKAQVQDTGGECSAEALVAFARSPYRLLTMPFGKHFGERIEQIPGDYIAWALGPKGPSDLRPDLKWTLEDELARRSRPADRREAIA